MKTLDEIYARVPKLVCARKCMASCGPIWASPLETARMLSLGFDITSTARGVVNGAPLALSHCPALRGADCRAYAARPLICRLWGVVERMRCPFGCRPQRWLSDDEARQLLLAAEGLAV